MLLELKSLVLYSWVSLEKDKLSVVGDENSNPRKLVEELNRLRKENARLKEEREILKKVAVFFAK